MTQRQGAIHRSRLEGGSNRRTVAIVGAGASGTLAAVHMLRRTGAGLRIVLIDRADHGPGVAYSTTDVRHRLNVPAGGMSAFAEEPDDLLRWCRARGIVAGPDDYLPRAVFGDYLRSLLRRFGDPTRLQLLTGAVRAVDRAPGRDGLCIALADGRRLLADAGVLALGNAAPAPLPGVQPSPAYVPDPWAPGALARAADARRVVIVGTGLTAVDIALSASSLNPELEICLVSRHGWLPRVHSREPVPARAWKPDPSVHGALAPLLGAISAAIGADPGAWRQIVDGLRPHTNELWQQLSIDDRRRFLGELKAWWDVHRHRMAPAIGDEIDRLRRAGKLTVMGGAMQGATHIGGAVEVELHSGASVRRLRADVLINATGPAGPLAQRDGLLTAQLLASGDAVVEPLGLGFACDADGRLLSRGGPCADRLFTLGPPRRGELLETTAIPEIRSQAAALSRALASPSPGQELTAPLAAAAAG